MKIKLFLLAAITIWSGSSFAQKGELNKAKASYNKFNELKGVGSSALGKESLKEAKVSLDKASINEKTSGLPETWVYTALVNADLALLDSTDSAKTYIDAAISALDKAKSLNATADVKDDEKKQNTQNLDVAGRMLAQYELNKGVKAFEKQDYKTAFSAFDNGGKYLPNDTTFIYYAGLAAINSQDYPHAIEKYKQLTAVDSFSNQGQIYLDLSKLYVMQGDTINALKYVEEGVGKFPNNKDLATQNIELNLMTGNEQKVINTINAQIVKDPKNKNLPFYLGIAYNATKDTEKAEAAYKKAIEIDPNYSDAYINLGGLILNRGIDKFNSANQLPADKQNQYDAQIKEAHSIFDTALPYLQKAVELDPKSKLGWQNLKTYYQIKENKEKMAEIDAKIQAL
ncbi:Tetratricopeptide repeat-containing protein [bacterium A37T11]|nr:Tetratricopeptide repeat-containing protein [bacterium A37T11]